ncbi:MAG: cytochrome c [Gemmatimonadetes bacterium]|nr:cytochrome c [Gemmatimonadota bacterium]MYC92705.1 cytochrome c [Gemmatimonadota bacterium]
MARQSLTRAAAPALLIASGILVAGCASGGAPDASAETPQPATEEAPPPATSAAEPPAESAPPPAEAEPTAPVGGIFTDAQAQRGRTTFDEVCSECHTTSEFRGRTFQRGWGRRTVYSFFRTVRSTMPDDNPGGLEEQIYLDVVSYILSINGHDGGPAELSADSPMREVRIAPSEPGR